MRHALLLCVTVLFLNVIPTLHLANEEFMQYEQEISSTTSPPVVPENSPDLKTPSNDDNDLNKIPNDLPDQILIASGEEPPKAQEIIPKEPEIPILDYGKEVEKSEDVSNLPDVASEPEEPLKPEEEKLLETSENDTSAFTSNENDTEHEGIEEEIGEEKNMEKKEEEKSENETGIPSFSEWTKLQLEKKPEVRKTNNITRQDGKNFASPDCGAKVIGFNPETQNPSGILSSSHDEYMLNRCGVSIYFTVELCESLQIEKVALGNLELFSSSPKLLELSISDRFPAREWLRFGPFEAPDSRNIHSFVLPSNGSSTFGKYLRVQIISHWGSEHYCPLSLLKVFGKSEYDVLEIDNNQEETESSLSEGEIAPEPNQQSVFNSASNVIGKFLQKVTNTLITPSSVEQKTNSCMSVSQCVPEQDGRADVERLLSCESRLLRKILGWSEWCGWDYCHGTFSGSSVGSPHQLEGFLVAVYSPQHLIAACHHHRPLKVCIEDYETFNYTQPVNASEPKEEIRPSESNGKEEPIPIPQPVENEEVPPMKESVFVRLSNRIKVLERNQTLSSGYLEELSMRFKKQTEDYVMNAEIMRKNLNISTLRIKYLEEVLKRNELVGLRIQGSFRDRLAELELQRGLLFFFVFIQFCGILFFVMRIKSSVKRRLKELEEEMIGRRPVLPTESNLSRKRISNDFENLKPKKKKKKKSPGFTFRPNNIHGPMVPNQILKASRSYDGNLNIAHKEPKASTESLQELKTVSKKEPPDLDQIVPTVKAKKKGKLMSLVHIFDKKD